MTAQFPFIVKRQDLAVDIKALVDSIACCQMPDGRIPWSPGEKTDPWDHVEAAMGLTVGGEHARARHAFEWLRQNQREDGSWFAAYGSEGIIDHTCETNHAAYLAVGLCHYYLITRDLAFIEHMWPTVAAGIAFTLHHQAPTGEIYWARNPHGAVDEMALLAGCSAICLSIKCALALARLVGCRKYAWRQALERLENCIRHRPYRFNMTKARYSMDWFYPVLCGAVTEKAARARIDAGWKKFVIQNTGVRCVSDQPWVTIAESCELIMTLAAMGNDLLAHIVFSWICDHRFADGTFWCGFTFPDMVLWPEEKITWTNAVVLLAADTLFHLTPAADLFRHQRSRLLAV